MHAIETPNEDLCSRYERSNGAKIKGLPSYVELLKNTRDSFVISTLSSVSSGELSSDTPIRRLMLDLADS